MAGVFELDLGETRENPEDISEDDELEITDEHIEVRKWPFSSKFLSAFFSWSIYHS